MMTKFGLGAPVTVSTPQGAGACSTQVGGFRSRRFEIESAALQRQSAPSAGVVLPAQLSVSGGWIGSLQRRLPRSLHRARSSTMASRRSRRIRVTFFAMNLLPSLNSRWTQLVLPSPTCAKRSRTWHSIALAHCGSVTLARGARQIAGVNPVPRAVEERRSRALDAVRDRLVGRVAVVIDVLAVEVLGARLRDSEAAEPEPRQEGRGDTHPSPGEPLHHGP